MMTYFHMIWAWILANPWETVFIFWTCLNVLWAQLPKPKSQFLAGIWDGVHAFFQLVVTHVDEPGTLTWPSLFRLMWNLVTLKFLRGKAEKT